MNTNTPVEQQRRSHETPVVGEWCWLTTEVTEAGAVLDGPGSVWIHAGCFSIVLTITQLVLTSSSCKQQQLWLLHVLYVILTACLDVTCLVCHLSSTCYLFYVIYQSLHVTCRMSSNLSSCKLNPSSSKWQEYWVGQVWTQISSLCGCCWQQHVSSSTVSRAPHSHPVTTVFHISHHVGRWRFRVESLIIVAVMHEMPIINVSLLPLTCCNRVSQDLAVYLALATSSGLS